MNYRYRLVEVIPNVYCLRYEASGLQKGLVIRKELGKYHSLVGSKQDNMIDKINFFSVRTCITKIRMLDLNNMIYTSGIEIFRNGPNKISENVNWKSIWTVEE
jgi:hypothetical protein